MLDLDESAGLWSLFLSAFISSTLLPGGSEALLLYLATQTGQNTFSLWLVASLGNTLGGITTLALGWWLAKRYPGKAPGKKKHQAALVKARRYGSPILLFSWVPVIGDPLCFAAGWLKLPLFSAIIFIFLGKAVRYAVLLAII